MAESAASVRVEVVYALPDEQALVTVTLPAPATVEAAIRASGLLERFPDIDLGSQSVGVFARVATLTDELADGDRVEIYRPLKVDPKEMRRRRAAGQR